MGAIRRALAFSLWLALALAGTTACERAGGAGSTEKNASAGATRQRVNSVTAVPRDVDPRGMCDVFHEKGKGPAFAWPELTGDAPTLEASRWSWINVWATWCKPCVEELPRLRRWQSALGDRVAIRYVSADESDEVVETYRKKHPGLRDTVRVVDPDKLPTWLEGLGVAGAALPVHVFVAPGGEVRCVRASAVEDSDAPAIDALLQ